MKTLEQLLTSGKIDKSKYDTYRLFHESPEGARYFADRKQSSLMEEPPIRHNTEIVWLDGRRSVWREIQIIIDTIHILLRTPDSPQIDEVIDV